VLRSHFAVKVTDLLNVDDDVDRLLNDLVLWEPMAPKPIDTQETNSFMPGSAWSPQLVAQLMHQGPVCENFSTCKSGIQYGTCALLW